MKNKTLAEIRKDLERIACEYGPCDLVFADIESDTPDERVIKVMRLCQQLSTKFDARICLDTGYWMLDNPASSIQHVKLKGDLAC